ncbi:MAG: hypothetical protein JSS02_15710 [Planctomycetes bacterium]|nr:hypothetical protein [Planctomycetota bacterium]
MWTGDSHCGTRTNDSSPRTWGKWSRCALTVLLCVALAAGPASAVDTNALRRKQDAQERARDMAKQLLTGVLDIQLQQLEENGLKQLPLYRDIANMRKNIGALVDKEMEQVVELLALGQKGTDTDRDDAFRQARQMIRQIVARLAAERQNLMRRLKSAEIAAQVQRLIDLESKVWQTTKGIPEQLPARQEALLLGAIEDQGDVKQMFLQLVETLADVSQWGGPLGTGGTEGLQILQAAGVGKELDAAGTHLAALRYGEAATSQQRVIKGLRLLLEKMNDTQSALSPDRSSAVALARQLMDQQEKLRDQTKQADLTQPDAEKLVEAQAEIRKQLNNLSQALSQMPAAETLLEQAKAAAYEATGKLFEARGDEAIAEQTKVLANLASLAEQMSQAADVASSDRSSQEAARQVRDLEQARADLEKIRQQQSQVDRTAQENAQGAAPQERQVSQDLSKVDDNRSLPKAVMTRLAAAEQAAMVAADALAKNPAGKADATRRDILEQADRAVERAAAEITAALDDARRVEKGVMIGELARAAETLERAAAAEREIAKDVQAAAKAKLPAEKAKDLGEQQAAVAALAKAVAQAVEPTAAEAAEGAKQAAQAAAESQMQLEQAATRPGEPAEAAAQAAAKSAASAADKLAQAAARLREQIGKTAEALATESAQQLTKVTPVREAVDQALANQDDSAGDQLKQLSAAEKAVREAQVSQQRASGRPEAADAMQLADAIADAQEEQSRADEAARQLAAGKSSSPLETITREQSVAEKAGKLAEKAGKRPAAKPAMDAGKPDPLSESLKDAAQAANRAARAALDNDPAQAQASRDQARQALDRAAHLAAAETEQASQAPAGEPDPVAQGEVTEAITDAAKMTPAEAPDASASLAQAEQSSGAAKKQAEAGDSRQATNEQQKTSQSLQQAAEQLQKARDKMSQEQAQQLTKQAQQANDLATRAAEAEPSALAALRDAQQRAQQGAADTPEQPQRGVQAQNQVEKDLQRAAANLAAREQRLQRDKAIAEAVRDLARSQAQAAQEIAQRSQDLLAAGDAEQPAGQEAGDQPAPGEAGAAEPGRGKPAQGAPASKQRQAAERLSQAQREFAQAQRGTGEAAEELTGQSNIGNRALRDAMARASKLMPRNMPQSGDAAAPPAAPGTDPAAKPAGEAAQSPAASQDPNAELGTGFIPNSPEATAEMMAGREASAKAAAELGSEYLAQADNATATSPEADSNQDADSAQSASRDPQSADNSQRPSPSSSSSTTNKAAQNEQGPDNTAVKSGPQQIDPQQARKNEDQSKPTPRTGDVDFASRAVGRESWFARLPPDLRKAIRAKAQRPPPRSYEDKLQKYFESID